MKVNVYFYMVLLLCGVENHSYRVSTAQAIAEMHNGIADPCWPELVRPLVNHVITPHLKECSLVFVSSPEQLCFTSLLTMETSLVGYGTVNFQVTDTQGIFTESDQENFIQKLWENDAVTCTAIIIRFTSHNTNEISRFLNSSNLWSFPNMKILIIGEGGGEQGENLLLHHSFQNTLHALYLEVDQTQKDSFFSDERGDLIRIYRRCHFCMDGGAGVHRMQDWRLSEDLPSPNFFPDEFQDFKGRKLTIIGLRYPPYLDYQIVDGVMRLKDCSDRPLVQILSETFNFTYVGKEPKDGTWGYATENGSYTGIVGALERREGDLSFVLGSTADRLRVMEFSPQMLGENMVIISLKPGFLPQNLALLKPFAPYVWLCLFIIMVVLFVVIWNLQRVRLRLLGSPRYSLVSSFFHTWGTLFEESPSYHPSNMTARVMMGFWLITCLVLTSAYRSSLVSHLTVRKVGPPVDSFAGLASRLDWTSGAEEMFFSSSSMARLIEMNHPAINDYLSKVQKYTLEENLARVLKGNHAFVTWDSYIELVIVTNYTDAQGNNPFYMGIPPETQQSSYSWGFRKGSPFKRKFDEVILRLLEAGIPDFWIRDVFRRKEVEARKRALSEQDGPQMKADENKVVLSMVHLQGAFYTLLFGHAIALVTFFCERTIANRISNL